MKIGVNVGDMKYTFAINKIKPKNEDQEIKKIKKKQITKVYKINE